ncbi:MAG TPA: hypothetical protein VIK75_10655 [Calditerricola sp.]
MYGRSFLLIIGGWLLGRLASVFFDAGRPAVPAATAEDWLGAWLVNPTELFLGVAIAALAAYAIFRALRMLWAVRRTGGLGHRLTVLLLAGFACFVLAVQFQRMGTVMTVVWSTFVCGQLYRSVALFRQRRRLEDAIRRGGPPLR